MHVHVLDIWPLAMKFSLFFRYFVPVVVCGIGAKIPASSFSILPITSSLVFSSMSLSATPNFPA